MRSKEQTVKGFMQRHIIIFAVLMLAFAFSHNIINSMITAPFEDSVTASNLMEALCKYITALLPLFLMKKWGFVQKAGLRYILTGVLLGIPSILLIVENLSPFAVIAPASYKVQWLSVLAIVVANFGVGLMEEACCRGVLLPMLCEKWSGQKNCYMKAALFSSALFGCMHFSWIINALVFNGSVSAAECIGRLYQVYYAFCFGMLCAGVTLLSRSIIPMVIWHSLVDVAAGIGQGILYRTTYQHFFELNPIGPADVLVKMGALRDAGLAVWLIPVGADMILLTAGVIMVKRRTQR
ncbi:MAG: CPBP family intramembrane metalloprotease [Oscillibacter sp.]|nr:CPBP family intramembrane metalloprotease [Oscillibacter sp.]